MIYELRTYAFRPGDLAAYVEAFAERGLPVISRHLRLLGYWISETGPAHHAYHLWVHRSRQERLDRRADLYADEAWTAFFGQARALVLMQSSELLTPVSTYGPDTSALPTHAGQPERLFELRTYEFSLPGAAAAEASLARHGALLDRHLDCIGYWRAVSGSLGRIRSLWTYRDEDDRDRRQAALAADPGFAGWMQDIGGPARSVVSEILRPARFSPIA